MIVVNNLWERPASLKWKSVHLTAKQQHSNAKMCSSQISRCFVANIHSCCVQALPWNFAEQKPPRKEIFGISSLIFKQSKENITETLLGKKEKKERTEIKLILVSLFKSHLIQFLPNTEEVTSHREHKKFQLLYFWHSMLKLLTIIQAIAVTRLAKVLKSICLKIKNRLRVSD